MILGRIIVYSSMFSILLLIFKSITSVFPYTVNIEYEFDCPSELSLALLLIDQQQSDFALALEMTYGQKVDIS